MSSCFSIMFDIEDGCSERLLDRSCMSVKCRTWYYPELSRVLLYSPALSDVFNLTHCYLNSLVEHMEVSSSASDTLKNPIDKAHLHIWIRISLHNTRDGN